MTDLLVEIVELLVGGITQVATGVGTGMQSLVTNLFLTVDGGLSNFGGLIIIFGGVSLALGLCYFVVNWLTSWGN